MLNYFVFPEKNVVLQSTKWSVGREARQSSAKASTAVRICHRPRIWMKTSVFTEVFYFTIPESYLFVGFIAFFFVTRKIKENFLTTYSFESENLLKNSHLQGEAYN